MIPGIVLRLAPSGLTWTASYSVARGVDGGAALTHTPTPRAGPEPVLDGAHGPRVGKREFFTERSKCYHRAREAAKIRDVCYR